MWLYIVNYTKATRLDVEKKWSKIFERMAFLFYIFIIPLGHLYKALPSNSSILLLINFPTQGRQTRKKA